MASDTPAPPCRLKATSLVEGEHIAMLHLDYLDPTGKQRAWDSMAIKATERVSLLVTDAAGRVLLQRSYLPPCERIVVEVRGG